MVLTSGSLLGVSIPAYWEAIVLIYLLAMILPIFPPSGYVPPGTSLWLNLKAMILPSFVLGTHSAGLLARFVRSSLLEVLGQDFIRTARAKGLTERAVVYGHALKNAGLPVLTTIGTQIGFLLGGTILVETIFQWPGMGRYAVGSITSVDFPAVMGVTVLGALFIVIANLIVDIVYAFLDPRVRYT
jgi:peptide/nickel transport system permease protein